MSDPACSTTPAPATTATDPRWMVPLSLFALYVIWGSTYLGIRYALLEPMDIVLITDSTLGLAGAAVRITQIEEDDNGELTLTAEEIPGVTP